MKCVRFANAMNNTTIIDPFNSDNSNIANIKTQHCQIKKTITNGILKFKPTIKQPIVADNIFFTVITFNRINSFIFFNSSILVQLILYFCNSLSLSMQKDINLLFLPLPPSLSKYSLILGNVKTIGLITSSTSKDPVTCLKIFFVSTNFEMTILIMSTSQSFNKVSTLCYQNNFSHYFLAY